MTQIQKNQEKHWILGRWIFFNFSLEGLRKSFILEKNKIQNMKLTSVIMNTFYCFYSIFYSIAIAVIITILCCSLITITIAQFIAIELYNNVFLQTLS